MQGYMKYSLMERMSYRSPQPHQSLQIACSETNQTCSLPYKVHKIDISKDTQKEPWFRAINPNGRIPALTDTFTDGKTINLFESGSIMQYLVDRYDSEYKISFPRGTREYYEMVRLLCTNCM
jgi:glutathione S-transferase